MYDLLLRDATIVTSRGRQVADVAVTDGRIVYVGPRAPKGPARVELSAMGKFLIPGIIDSAVQFDGEGGGDRWESESRAALTGGVTTVIQLPGGERPVLDRASARQRTARIADKSWTHFGLWGGAVGGNAAELAAARAEGLIVGLVAYLGEKDGMGVSVEALPEFFAADGTIAVHLNDHGGADTVDGLRKALEAARTAQKQVHVLHLSRADELQLLDPVRGELPVTTGVTPHHLFFSDEPGRPDVTTNPRLRPELDRRSLWTAMKRGRLDVVASDHHHRADAGVPGAEVMFPLLLSAVKSGRISLELLVSVCCESPARIFGLERKGRVVKGADADLVLFTEGELKKLGNDALLSSAGWSPYVDVQAAPKPDLVVLGGSIVAQRGQIVAKGPTGRSVL